MSDESPHLKCIVCSGTKSKLAINLFLNLLGVILVSFLINTAMDIKAGIEVNKAKISILEHKHELQERGIADAD